MKIVAVIPARMGSSRFPGKPLVSILGKPMIQHVYERTAASEELQQTIVATDSKEIFEVVKKFGGNVVMTDPHHPNGTSRIAEAIQNINCDIVLNIQGDEPLVNKTLISELIEPFLTQKEISMSTLKKQIDTEEEVINPNVVKVVCDNQGKALYFSRCPIPYDRDGLSVVRYRHIGMYGYRKDFLPIYFSLEPAPLEQAESLEQLRVISNGYNIYVRETNIVTVDVNVKEDLFAVEKLLKEGK